MSEFFGSLCDIDLVHKEALNAFSHGNEGELFLEHSFSEVFKLENGVIQTPEVVSRTGFGLRTFFEDTSKYSYSSNLTPEAVRKAVSVVSNMSSASNSAELGENFKNTPKITYCAPKLDLYPQRFFIEDVPLVQKIKFLNDLDRIAKEKYPNVVRVSASIASNWQAVSILSDSGVLVSDFRPMVRFSVSVIASKGERQESGIFSGGGRVFYDFFNDETRDFYLAQAVRQAEVKLDAISAPAGQMPVVLGNGLTGILLHEAIGHGLEGDAVRKKSSAFHSLLNENIASSGITVVDDGTIQNHRGSLNIDDEGVQTERTVLIENGKLCGFMMDRMNAKLAGVKSTGSGRRESFEFVPIPRMRNTFMLAGTYSFDEMISSVSKGIFAKTFSGGQVDVTSGKFVFSASEAYLIENGKITTPVKGAMLIGDGPTVLKSISMVGNDLELDSGVGTCGKAGQWVPVGIGMPSVLVDELTVGGANL